MYLQIFCKHVSNISLIYLKTWCDHVRKHGSNTRLRSKVFSLGLILNKPKEKGEENFWPEKNVWFRKEFGLKTNFDLKNVRYENCLAQQNFGSKAYLCPKKLCVRKYFRVLIKSQKRYVQDKVY